MIYVSPVVIMRSVNIGGNDGSKVAAVLFVVAAIQHVDHALSVSIPYTSDI